MTTAFDETGHWLNEEDTERKIKGQPRQRPKWNDYCCDQTLLWVAVSLVVIEKIMERLIAEGLKSIGPGIHSLIPRYCHETKVKIN